MEMPFGKYKGCPLSDLDDDYLDWLVENVDLFEPLKSAIEEEVLVREPDAATMMDIVKAGYRSLALKYHPDHGGTHEQMKLLNASVETLRRVVKQIEG